MISNRTPDDLSEDPTPPRIIGPYRLVERIGIGGMGEVWLAEQELPLRRRVAIKLVRAGRDSHEVLARFEAERQALALMEHPNIARVIEAGEHVGRPYFVMEYVPGAPIHEYCDRAKLGIPARLELFRQVCLAVQHAHQKAILHRDLKPNNVLVTEQDGRALPKVIDFGVAKAMAQPFTNSGFETRIGQVVGTPLYMSPEQADSRAHDVDTRSDVYSLGVILYELLTGALPFEPEELAAAGYEGMLRILCEKTPARPSTRVDTLDERAQAVATARGRKPHRLRSELDGDLDWITMRCLEKDRDRRYAGPGELMNDIERHLRNEPVEAGPPKLSYRLGRFVRRHRAGIAVASSVLVLMIATGVALSVQAHRIAGQRDVAQREARRAEAAHLYTLGVHDEIASRSLAYAIASLELTDQAHVRELALRALQAGPTFHSLDLHPAGWQAHNPWAVRFSPDGAWLAVGWSQGGFLRVYSIESGAVLELSGHEGWITQLAFTADSQQLVSCGTDGFLRLWSLPDGACVRAFETEPSRTVGLRLLTGTQQVIAYFGTDTRELTWYRWDLVSGHCDTLAVWQPEAPDHAWGEPDIDPRGRWVVRGRGREIELVALDDLDSGVPIPVGEHGARWTGARFSGSGAHLVTLDARNEVKLWSSDDPTIRALRTVRVGGTIAGVEYGRDDRWFAVGYLGGTDVYALQGPVHAEPLHLEYIDGQWGFRVVEHPSRPWMAMTSTFGRVGAWSNPAPEPIVLRPRDAPQSLVFTPDGRHLVIGNLGSIVVWPLDGDPSGEPRTLVEMDGVNFSALTLDDRGEWIYAGACNGATDNGLLVIAALDGSTTRTSKDGECIGSIAVSADERFLASVVEDARRVRDLVRIWDLEAGTSIDVMVDDWNLHPIDFAADGRLAVLRMNQARSNELGWIDPVDGSWSRLHQDVRACFALVARRWLLWTDSNDAPWSTDALTGETRRLAADVTVPRSRVARVDPRCETIAFGDDQGRVHVRSLDGTRSNLLLGHDRRITAVAFDPRERWIASASSDGTVRLDPIPRDASILELPVEELLATLRARTTLRAVSDSSEVSRYRIENVEFGGWSEFGGQVSHQSPR